jgi:glycosyltransferase involved in cell wall biosynthesis
LEIAGADDSSKPYQPELEKIIDELKLKDRVTLLGAVSEQAVRDGLEKSHAFVLASLDEPLGVAIMEAMAMEVPVVVTGSGGVAELVDDEIDGVLVEPRDPSGIAAGIERIARDGALSTRLASAGRQKVIRSFQSDRSAQALLLHIKG